MASNRSNRQRAIANRRKEKKETEEKKLIDAIIKDEETSNKKLGILRKHPYYKTSVAKAKREAEVRKKREKEGKPPENILEKSKRQREESDAAKAKAKAEANAKKQKPKETAAEKAAKFAKKQPEVNQAKKVSKKESTPEKTGSEYKAYPGAAGRAGFQYGRDITEVLDDKTVSDEIKERIEEEELYEGDFKGGRVGKGKKKKVSQAPRGVRAALRGFKPKMGASKGNKRTRGTGGGWV
jgi:hypothetical protein